MTETGRSLFRTVEAAVAHVRENLTEGQRWTSALALSLAALVLFAGLPTAVTRIPDRASPVEVAAGDDVPAEVSSSVPTSAPIADPGSGSDVVGDRPHIVPGPAPEPAPLSPPPAPAVDPPPGPTPSVVLVVRADDAPAGRDDAAMADAFLGRSGFDATVVAIGASSDDTCAEALAGGSVVVASEAVPPDLERCLLDGNATVVSFGRSNTGARMVSTRRDLGASLVDLARWGVAGGALEGRVGVVGHQSERDGIEAAAERMRAAGADVAEVAFVDGEDPGSVTDALRSFVAENIDVAVLAMPMDIQRQWAAQQPILAPGLRTVVSDAFDAVADESYPPAFDGALAHTSLRVPWFSRSEGETVAQARCRQTWEESAQTMLASETVRAFAWCQHLSMVGEALRSGAGGDDFHETLRANPVESPLTSTLGPLPGGGFGPLADAALVWRASCTCWQPVRGFARR